MKKILIILFCFLGISLNAHNNEPLNESIKVPRLSPLSVDFDKNNVNLNGDWKFSPSPKDAYWKTGYNCEWSNIEVPGEWCMQGYSVKEGTEAAYKRSFLVPQSWSGQRIKLRCNGVYSESRLFINGKSVGEHFGGFTAFEFDITDFVKIGAENSIVIGVKSRGGLADSLSYASNYAVHDLGGITRDIFIFPLPTSNISLFHISTYFDKDYNDAELRTEVELANESKVNRDGLSLKFILRDREGKKVEIGKSTYPVSLKADQVLKKNITFNVKSPKKWDTEHPYLYKLTCELVDENAKVLHETVRRVGFRQIEVRGNQVFVNNMPIKLHGVCRHEVMPLRGRSVNGDTWRKDVEIFKQGNVNYIRTSHYPPDERLFEACDELGMFVEEEAPFCWAHSTKVNKESWHKALENQHIEMVNRDKSHPSILMWSLGNESDIYLKYFKGAGKIVKELDPSRPRILSAFFEHNDNKELEIGNHHYPGPTGPNKYRDSKRPVIFDEYCHLNAYNRLELASDPGLRDMWGEMLDEMYTDMYHSQGVLGGALWAGIDDTFFLPDGKTVGYGTWGPIDGWRRLKPEYWNMKKAFSPVKISQESNLDQDGNLKFIVENRFNFTNLSEVKFIWKTYSSAHKDAKNSSEGEVSIDLNPRTEGNFTINLPKEARKDAVLEIDVLDVDGLLIDKYSFNLQLVNNKQVKEKLYKLSLKETSNEIVVNVKDHKYTFNKKNGMIDYSPTLMLLPLNGEGRGTQMTGEGQNFDPYNPRCTRWIAKGYNVIKSKDSVVIEVEGSYKEAAGKYTYTFKRDGSLTVDYDFVVKEPVSPRQVGVVFTLPGDYDVLKWKREGYWNVYPENHIGAIEGSAKAFDSSLPVSGLAGPSAKPDVDWSKDQTEAGSNGFRSTKENIYWASLTSSKVGSQTWEVVSNGHQSLRAWRECGKIMVLVADYVNHGSERFESPFNSRDFRPLRKGDKVSGSILLK